MAVQEVVTLTVTKWVKHNPRQDVKKPFWFRLENSLVEDSDFYDFTHEEFKVWIYILSLASKKNSEHVRLNFAHASATARLTRKGVESAILKLEQLQLVLVNDTDATRDLHAIDTDAYAIRTLQDKQTDKTDTTHSGSESPRTDRLPVIAKLWNTIAAKQLPRVRDMSASSSRRKACETRWRERSDESHWTEVINRINASNFCMGGNDKGWRADIDFLTRPDTDAKVLEGKYDNPVGPPVTPRLVDPYAGLTDAQRTDAIRCDEEVQRSLREREEERERYR